MGLEWLRDRARWLRHEARLESIWIANLLRHGAGDGLVAEHRDRLARLDRLVATVEARIAELEQDAA